MRDIDDIEDECTKTVIKDVLMCMGLTKSAYHVSDLHEEVTRQILSRNIGDSMLHDSGNCILAKTLFCFKIHSKGFPQ